MDGENYLFNENTVIPLTNFNGSLFVPIVANDGINFSEPFQISIDVNSVNDTPLSFNLLTPNNGEIITILAGDIAEQQDLTISWSPSIDIDGDLILYGLEMVSNDWSSTVISGLPDTTFNLPYSAIISILDSLNTSELSIDWTVYSTDGIDTVFAEEIFTINIDGYDVLSIDEVLIPSVYALHQNYPNPFNPTTTLKYDLPEATLVSIKIFDILGKEVVSLVDNMHQNAGYKNIRWNGLNKNGKQVVSGMYFFTIKAGEFKQTRKMILMK